MARVLLGALAALMLLPSPAQAITTTFNGALDADWNKAGNWDNGVPTASDDAVIPGTPNAKSVTVSAAANARSVSLGSGSLLTLSGAGLTIAGGAPSTFAGSLHVASSTLQLGGVTTWSAGVWSLNTGHIINGTQLVVSGTDPQLQHHGGQAELRNPVGAVIDKTGAGAWHIGVALDNDGTLNTTVGTLSARSFGGVASTGLFNFSAGTRWDAWETMVLGAGASVLGGHLELNGGAFVIPAGAGTIDPDLVTVSGGQLDSAKNLVLDRFTTDGAGGSVVGAGTLTAAGPTTLNSVQFIGGGAITLTDPALSAIGSLHVAGTTLNLPGANKVWSAGIWSLNTAHVVNTGKLSVTHADPQLQHHGGQAELRNPVGAVIDKTGAGAWHIGVALDNDGTLNTTVGTLSARSFGGVASTGLFNFSAGTRWDAWETMVLGAGASVLGGHLELNGGAFVIPAGAGTIDPDLVTVSGGQLDSAKNLVLDRFTTDGAGGSVVGAGTLTAAGPTTLNSVQFIGGGAITLTDPALSAIGSLHVAGTTLNLPGANKVWSAGIWSLNTAHVVNTGKLSVTHADPQLQHHGGQAELRNPVGAVIDKTGAGAWHIGVALDNDGTLNTTVGTLSARTFGGVVSTGVFNFSAGTRWDAYDTTLLGTGAVLNGGHLELNGGIFTIPADAATIDPDLVTVSGGTLSSAKNLTLDRLTSDGAGGSVTGAGTLTAAGPTTLNNIHFNNGGAATLTDPALSAIGSLHVAGTTLNLPGANKVWSAGIWSLNTAHVVNTGKLSVTHADPQLQHHGGQAELRNPVGAVIDKTGAGAWHIGVALDNDGTLNTTVGTLSARTFGGVVSTGVFSFSSGTRWDAYDTTLLGTGAVLNGGHLELNGGIFTIPADAATIDPDLVTVSGGTLSSAKNLTLDRLTSDGAGGSVTGAGTLTAAGPTTLNNIHFNNGGAATLTDDALQATGNLHVAGTTLTLTGTDANWTAGTWSIVTGRIVNAGGLTSSALNAQLQHHGGVAAFDNEGTFTRSGTGTLNVGTPLETGGIFNLNAGTLTINNGALVDGGTLTLANGTELGSNGQTISVTGGRVTGTGTLRGTVSNSGGTVAPGASPGLLSITGDYTQGAGGTFETEVDGPGAGSGYDRLAVTGTATLAGTVAVINGHDPAIGSVFDVLTATTVNGTFSSLTGGQLAGKHYVATYPAGLVRLAVVKDAAVAPVNQTPPSIPGSAIEGDTVQCAPGTWVPAGDGFNFSWTRDGAPIGGQTTSSLLLTSADVGHTIRCVVIAKNEGLLSAPAQSNALVPGEAPPANQSAPAVTPGAVTAGGALTCETGQWSGNPTLTIAWLRDGAVIDGQTAATYTTVDGDAGRAISCRVTAVNGGGTASATSNAVTPSAKPLPAPSPTPTPAPVPTPTPTPTPSTTPVTVPIQQIATLPSAKKCVSRRKFRIRLRVPKGEKLVSANVFVNGKRVKAIKGRRLTAPVDLRGLPKGRWTVKIVSVTRSGKRLQATRKYRTCVPKKR